MNPIKQFIEESEKSMQKDYTKIDEKYKEIFKKFRIFGSSGEDNFSKRYGYVGYMIGSEEMLEECINQAISLSEQSILERVEKEIIYKVIEIHDRCADNSDGDEIYWAKVRKVKHLPQEEVKK
jgi:hypothetical protein